METDDAPSHVGRGRSDSVDSQTTAGDQTKQAVDATDAAALPIGQTWYGYVSTLPGGGPVSSDCVAGGPEARTTFTISQNPSSPNCKISTSGGIYYLNYFVDGGQTSRYRFNVSRAAQRLAAGSGK